MTIHHGENDEINVNADVDDDDGDDDVLKNGADDDDDGW